jgi:hypothetical protein
MISTRFAMNMAHRRSVLVKAPLKAAYQPESQVAEIAGRGALGARADIESAQL